ncbi:uncharacterized membrane protein YjgN (DUF898 family) [Duganella sp. SG902]|uniref:YjgN family protein n=1 Tax=Duganella sp. SG902 TaxID=2587016 RepID=UPI00159DDE07|nr:YjgN family protein [Duganella sp. SG902]NVM74932.1 uncharacterized membrane protein YjgN (DUF898 family) [Duganella sp. SG902]
MEQLLEQADVAPAVAASAPQRIKFHATGGEYFRIWIVNLLLTIVTLGIYSAWAKVRRNQYFYASTELAGASFEYHGSPVAILKGRIVAGLFVGAYALTVHSSPGLALLALLVLAAISPWFMWKSLQFRLHNTSYRGIRFRFAGDKHDAYINYMVRPWLSGVTAGLAVPFVHQRAKAWTHNNARYGNARFSFDAEVGDFYKLYGWFVLVGGGGFALLTWLIMSGVSPADGAAGAAEARAIEAGFVMMAGYAWFFLVYPLFMQMLQNLVWNHTSLEAHRFRSDMKWGRMVFITVTNYLAVICTLGLFLPFARVRTLRYRLESIALLPEGSLDDVLAAPQDAVGATGEGAADFFDFDLSI